MDTVGLSGRTLDRPAPIAPMMAARTLGRPDVQHRLLSNRVTPVTAILWGWGIWLAIFAVAPIIPRYPADWTPIILLCLCILAMVVGAASADLMPSMLPAHKVTRRSFDLILKLLLIGGAIGFLARAYDLYVIRDIADADNIVLARERVSRGGGNAVAIVAAALGPLGVAAALLAAIATRMNLRRRIGLVALGVACGAPALSILLGSRSLLMETFVYAILGTLLLTPRVSVPTVLKLAGLFVGAVVLYNMIFLLRAQDYSLDLKFTARYSVFTQLIPVEPWVHDLVDSSGPFQNVLISLVAMMQYMLHATFEYFLLVELKGDYFLYGNWQFFYVEKFFNAAFGTPVVADSATLIMVNPRAGAFQTLFGDMYIDFGFYSPFFCFLLGFVCGSLRRVIENGNMFYFPLYVFLLTKFVTSPLLGVSGGAGISMFVLFVFAVLASLYTRYFPMSDREPHAR